MMESVTFDLCDRKLIYILLVISFHWQLYCRYIGFSPFSHSQIVHFFLVNQPLKKNYVLVPLTIVYSFIIIKKINSMAILECNFNIQLIQIVSQRVLKLNLAGRITAQHKTETTIDIMHFILTEILNIFPSCLVTLVHLNQHKCFFELSGLSDFSLDLIAHLEFNMLFIWSV